MPRKVYQQAQIKQVFFISGKGCLLTSASRLLKEEQIFLEGGSFSDIRKEMVWYLGKVTEEFFVFERVPLWMS